MSPERKEQKLSYQEWGRTMELHYIYSSENNFIIFTLIINILN